MPVSELPAFIKSRKASFSMYIDERTQRPYSDDASIFRCLALHDHARRKLSPQLSYAERCAKLNSASNSMKMAADAKLLQWLEYMGLDEKEFRGVPLEQFGDLEQYFSTNIEVYRYEPPVLPAGAGDQQTEGEGAATDLGEQLVVEAEQQYQPARCEVVYVSGKKEPSGGTMLVNIYTDSRGVNHFSYIADLRRFAATHVCDKCRYQFPCARNLRVHKERQPDCDKVQHLFPGNGATLSKTLFERLDEAGVRIKEPRRYYPHFAVFDLESCAKSTTSSAPSKVAFTALPRLYKLPEDEPSVAAVAAPRRYRSHWQQLRTQTDASFRFCVVRGPFVCNIAQHAYALAQEQNKCFNLRVDVLHTQGRRLIRTHIGKFPGIRNEADFRGAATALLTDKLAKYRNARAYAVRLEVEPPAIINRSIAPLEAVSVAIATNIAGIESSFLCRREDDEPVENLVRAFVDRLYQVMRRSIVGGPACVYHRLHIAGKTRLRGNGALCQHIVGWDCNGLYLDCSRKQMPTGIPVRYTPQKDGFFKRAPIYRKLQSQIEWLEWTAHVYGLDIRHQLNSAKPPYVAGQRPDGYCVTPSGQRVVFFFDGCRYHGHGGCIANPKHGYPVGLDAKKKRSRDFAITKAFEERGYVVHRMRECTWMRMKRDNPRASMFAHFVPRKCADGNAYDPTLYEFRHEHTTLPDHGKMTEAALIRKVESGQFFGELVCDVEVPASLRAHFAEFEPIFKNVEVTENELSPLIRRVLTEQRGTRKRKLMQPRRTLVNSYFAKDAVLFTPLHRWYREHGLVIRNVTKACEYKPKVLYADFARTVANHRRRADADPDEAIKGDLFKLAGNSIYGKSVTAVERHTRTRVVDRNKLALLQRNYRLVKDIEWLDDEKQWAEVTLAQKKIEHKLYTPFGAFVYQYAKLRMLQFYYDFLDYYWDREHLQLMYMDTDSFYVALAQPSLAEFMKAVKPERAAQFKANYPEQFLARDNPDCYTAEQIKWDRREVGLFHVETQAKKMLALNAKSYICVDVSPSGFETIQKLSAKGVIRAQNSLTWDSFYNVLQTTRDHIGISRTLQRPRGRNEVCNITAPKRCLSYLFFKRRLLDDGVSTAPLGL